MDTAQHRKLRSGGNAKYVILVIFLVLLVGLGSFGIAYLINRQNGGQPGGQTEGSSTNTSPTSSGSSTDKSSTDSKESTPAEEVNDKKPAAYDGPDANSYSDLTGIVSAEIADSKISIRAAIDQTVSGTCQATITTPSGETITGASNSLDAGPSSSFCIDSVNLGPVKSGTYKIEIIVKSSNKTGKIVGEVNV